MAEQPATKGEADCVSSKLDTATNRLDARMDRFEETLKSFGEKLDAMQLSINSLRTGVELRGDLVPAPGDGIANADGDMMFLHRLTVALKRHKGGVVVVLKRRTSKVKRWKYE